MRSLDSIRKAYAGTSQSEATDIASGLAPSKSTGRPLEPVTVVLEGRNVILRDGRHRLQAAREAGARQILSEVRVPGKKPFRAILPI